MKPTITDYTDCNIVKGQRFTGDDSFWLVAEGRENEGPFESREDAVIYLRDRLRQMLRDKAPAAYPMAFAQLDG